MAITVADTRDEHGKWVRSYSRGGIKYETKSSRLWLDAKARCTLGSSAQKRNPTYIGCEMSDNFKDFQFFAEWCNNQVGYGLKGYHLDKDILFDGNKLYSESTCVFVPLALNLFLASRDALRGLYPQGVHLNRKSGRFVTQVKVDNKHMHVGIYATPEEASAAYKVAKEAEARRWHDRLKVGEYLVDPRVIERMRTWLFEDEGAKQGQPSSVLP